MVLLDAVRIIVSDKKTPGGKLLVKKNGEIKEIVVIQEGETDIILVKEEIVVHLNVATAILVKGIIVVLVIIESNIQEKMKAAIIEIKDRDLVVILSPLNEIEGKFREENNLQSEEMQEEDKKEGENQFLMIPELIENVQFLLTLRLHTPRIPAKETFLLFKEITKLKDERKLFTYTIQMSAFNLCNLQLSSSNQSAIILIVY